ncbi:MAG: TIGR00159 family protein [Firmicutes bacterium]|nr:TIGR00159 family protein [Bacillota bacterium]
MLLNQIRFLSLADLVVAVVDIAIVSYLIYKFLTLVRGTRAVQLIRGILILLVGTLIAGRLRLYTINWLLVNARTMLFVALPVVFQPELRRALEQIGRGKLFSPSLAFLEEVDVARLIEETSRAAEVMARNKCGALIVVERETGLTDYVETGVRIDALVTAELLINLFVPGTPLHDGAVIIRGNRIVAASCFLPLTDAADLSIEFGSRHRAALGITEHSDALAVVVSEETGTISLANAGKFIRYLDGKTLREMLSSLCKSKHAGLRRRG